MKIVDGINMAEVKAAELKDIISAFNKAKVGVQIKPGANPLGSAKAFVKSVEGLNEDKQAKLPEEVIDYYNRIVVDEAELAKQQGNGSQEEKEPKAAKKPPALKPVKTEKKTDGAKTERKAPTRDPNKPTKKSIVIAMVSKGKGATLDEMGQAMTEAGLGDFDRNKTTAGLWIKKLGFKVSINEKTGKISKAE